MPGDHSRTRIALTVLLAASLAVGGVAAQSGDSGSGLFGAFSLEGSDADSPLARAQENLGTVYDTISAGVDRIAWSAQAAVADTVGVVDHPAGNATDTAASVQSFVNDRSAEIADYINAHVAADRPLTEMDVVEVRLQGADGDQTLFVVASVADGNVSSLSVVDSTARTVDFRLAFSEYATQRLHDDLEWAYQNYVAPDEPHDGALTARWASTYYGEINVTEVGS